MKLLRNLFESSQVELTKRPNRQQVSAAWPDGVMWNGISVFDLVYNSNVMDQLEKTLKRENSEFNGFDSQESYLGYSPKRDVFLMGWDTWADSVDNTGYHGYNDADEDESEEVDETHNTIAFKLNQKGEILDAQVIDTVGRMMYGRGGSLDDLHRMYPELIDVRLD